MATDRETQAKLTAAFVMASGSPSFALPAWKLPDGSFVGLDNADVLALATAVLAHVQESFALEKQAADAIAAGEITTLAAVDALFAAP